MAGSDYIRLNLPSTLRYLNVLHTTMAAMVARAQMAVSVRELALIKLAIQETGTNIVRHAYQNEGGRFEIIVSLNNAPPEVLVTTSDQGIAFDPTQVAIPEPGELREDGMGLFLTCRAMDEVRYQSSDGRAWRFEAGAWRRDERVDETLVGMNRWWLRKRLAVNAVAHNGVT